MGRVATQLVFLIAPIVIVLSVARPAQAQTCQESADAAHTAATEYRSAVRAVARKCALSRKRCLAAKEALDTAFAALTARNEAVLDNCITPSRPVGEPPAFGDLVITEIMANPLSVADSVGEWFEVLNVSGKTLNLAGLTISNSSGSVTVSTNLTSRPGTFLVFGRSNDQTMNGGVVVNYVYDTLVLANTAPALTIAYEGETLDTVNLSAGSEFIGKALSLDPTAFTFELNDNPANWCAAQAGLPGGDLGTPGGTNPSC